MLQAIRQMGALAGAELARCTGLSAQAVSLITRRLEADGLLLRGEPVRGKVGQPALPWSLNPDGALSVGIQLGRRSLDTLVVDFHGAVRQRWSLAYTHPEPQALLHEIGQRLGALRGQLAPAVWARVQGVGVAAPQQLGGWQTLLDMPPELAARWQTLDLRAALASCTELPVMLLKDTAAACVAELVAGRGRGLPNYLYLFVDTFIGGGLVLDGQLRAGDQGNAGAVGSLSLAMAGPAAAPDGPPQLLSRASLLSLERRYRAAGLAPEAVADARALQAPWRGHTEAWLDEAAPAIALAVHSAACLLDLDTVLIDGAFDRALLAALLARSAQALQAYRWEGVARPQLLPGSVGADARALGGAWLPLHAAFAPERGAWPASA
ncbi:ROK family transcriptional regulator [Aquabacterium sp. OR-4]|uniref:ROK family transcriptional regulator n=1 Tax=Aquabacterium sp. OR-4 TaxID=2978127 RepID=UPI0028CA6FD4|nr:ROK family transcriptional regulator [Aquabacterium sp. OR-4]MDT7834061.1 ROK family transcriptional regulator [Aquabacterium sp. OR-4]